MLSQADKTEIVSAITASETSTSGEIRIHIDSKGSKDPFVEAKKNVREIRNDKDPGTERRIDLRMFSSKAIDHLGRFRN